MNNYRNAIQDLYEKRLQRGNHYLTDGKDRGEVAFLEGLLTLNNEYQGLGLTATVMSSGLDFVSQNTLVNHAGLFKKLIEFNGTADKAQAMAQIAESGHYRIDQLDMAERLWMGENDARQRAYVNNWRQAKWAKQDAFEKLKREMKEARDKANKEWFEQNYGHPGSHGGVASVAGTNTLVPGAASNSEDPKWKEFWLRMEMNRWGATGAITPDYTFERMLIPMGVVAKMFIFSNSGSSTVIGLNRYFIYIRRTRAGNWQKTLKINNPNKSYRQSVKTWDELQNNWEHYKDW